MIVAFVVLLFAAVDVARGTLLPINQHRPCMATFNGSLALDLEPFFQWPVRAQFVPGNAPGGYYSYEYDCAGKRTVCGPGVAVCQIRNDHITFEAGGSPLKALWFSGTYSPIPQVSLEIRYPVRLLPKQLLFAESHPFADFAWAHVRPILHGLTCAIGSERLSSHVDL